MTSKYYPESLMNDEHGRELPEGEKQIYNLIRLTHLSAGIQAIAKNLDEVTLYAEASKVYGEDLEKDFIECAKGLRELRIAAEEFRSACAAIADDLLHEMVPEK